METDDDPFEIIEVDENEEEDVEKIETFKKNLDDKMRLTNIPEEIRVSTLTITCTVKDIVFNCDNIARYIDLSEDGVVSVTKDSGNTVDNKKYNEIIYRSSIPKKKNVTKKRKKIFFNQVSLCVNAKDMKNVHVKLFSNGSIQMAGCTRDSNITVLVLTKLFHKLKHMKLIYNSDKKEFIEKPFVSNIESLDISNIDNISICMINTDFRFICGINLVKLHTMITELTEQKNLVESRFDRINHSSVAIKYSYQDKKITILVFEKGAIVITGARNGDQITQAYNYINKFLLANYKKLVKKEITQQVLDDCAKNE
jgi:TATA-box binding protein (TBP) (component of TFIID and TFIIIB)